MNALHAVLLLDPAGIISTLRELLAPLLAICFTLWAAWLALAAEGESGLPKVLAAQLPERGPGLATARTLHVAHLALLVLAGASAGLAVVWWHWPAGPALARIVLATGLVWIVGDALPRLLASLGPDLPAQVRPGAGRSLTLLAPLLRLVAEADRRALQRLTRAGLPQTGPAERDMLLGVFSLSDTTVDEVMTPRLDVIAVDIAADETEVSRILQQSEHARLLVYEGHPDAISGVLFAKDMLARLGGAAGDRPWQELIRPAAFVPEGKTLDRQLRDFQRGRGHLAVVVDEFGGTAGIITLEDILEQIVGEIQDEYDTHEVAPIRDVGDGRLLVLGKTALSDLEEFLDVDFGREDVATVGGLVLAELGHVPRAGETVVLEGVRLMADLVVRRRVRRVRVDRLAPETNGAEPSP